MMAMIMMMVEDEDEDEKDDDDDWKDVSHARCLERLADSILNQPGPAQDPRADALASIRWKADMIGSAGFARLQCQTSQAKPVRIVQIDTS